MIDLSVRSISIEGMLTTAKKVILFGAGGAGVKAIRFLREKSINVLFFCDNDVRKHGKYVEGVKVFPAEELEKYKNEVVLISSDYAKEIGVQLRIIGVRKFYYFGYCFDFNRWYRHFDPTFIRGSGDAIEEAYNAFADRSSRNVFTSILKFRLSSDPTYLAVSDCKEYYHPKVMPRPGDTIIDGGAWTGDTAASFYDHLKGKCEIFSFEPDMHNFNMLLGNIKKLGLEEIITPVQLGLWEKRAVLRFSDYAENDTQYRIAEEGEKEIEVVSIDEFVDEKKLKIDLIKMDIEGAELRAIKGARNTISKFGPRLQICLYHEIDDLWKIPVLIKSMHPGYKLYLAHHTQNISETILYAEAD